MGKVYEIVIGANGDIDGYEVYNSSMVLNYGVFISKDKAIEKVNEFISKKIPDPKIEKMKNLSDGSVYGVCVKSMSDPECDLDIEITELDLHE